MTIMAGGHGGRCPAWHGIGAIVESSYLMFKFQAEKRVCGTGPKWA